MKILIATGIYPPALGGPAKYAWNLEQEWKKMGHQVTVKTFTKVEHSLPTGIRHLYYFLKIIPAVMLCDFIYALDTFSVGWPATCAARLFGKKIIMRTGGDFLWENYVERSKKLVLFKNFYINQEDWTTKERKIFSLMKWTLRHVDLLVFSTEWQKNVWFKPYGLDEAQTAVIENYYGPKEESFDPIKKDFIGGARPLLWKNIAMLKEIFTREKIKKVGATYHSETYPHEEFMDKIAHCYATLLVSLGDISPNMILDSIRHNKPFVITKENGLMDRISTIAVVADPTDPKDVEEKVLWLCDEKNYAAQVERIRNFNFTHTWPEIAEEIIGHYKKL